MGQNGEANIWLLLRIRKLAQITDILDAVCCVTFKFTSNKTQAGKK